MPALFALMGLLSAANAASPAVPSRQIPPSVLVELQLLENRFELALADDCAPDACYSNGCAYLDHAVADQARARSLPGLGGDPGPGSVEEQAWLTRAQCSFSHEASVDPAAAAAIVRRLQGRLTQGWTAVSVDHEALPAIPAPEAPAEDEAASPAPPPVEEAPAWTASTAGRELWSALLPHFYWMVGLGLVTLAGTALIWAWRRVGRASLEEQALLAQLGQPAGGATDGAVTVEPETAEEVDEAYVAAQGALWQARLASMDPASPDPELQALIRDRLRAGDLPFLARAVLRFPDGLPAAFPVDGETATAKLELAQLLQSADADALPADAAFFRALERHALAATLASQPDTRIVRSLREDFGAAGLVELIKRLPARLGALLFALAPPSEQHEGARLLTDAQLTALCQQLLRSNRMDPAETAALLDVLRGGRADAAALPPGEITDRGTTFDAAGALAVLLPRLGPERRAALFDEALRRFGGSLPLWHREIFVADMLSALSTEARADLLLAIDADPLAAWLSLVDPAARAEVLDGVPDSLRASVQGAPPAPSRAAQLALAAQGRRALARGFQRQLARAGVPFERAVRPQAAEQP